MGIFHGPDDPVYTISVAARLLRVSTHLLRQLEMEGFVLPARTESNIRLYSDNDLRLLTKVVYLSRDCGINAQGVRAILAMEGDYRRAPPALLGGSSGNEAIGRENDTSKIRGREPAARKMGNSKLANKKNQ